MGTARPAQWLGHAADVVAPPPSCATGAGIGSWLLWVDPTLSPGVPHARLTHLRFARSPWGAAAEPQPRRRSWYVVTLRRRKARGALLVQELAPVAEHAASAPGSAVLHGTVDLSVKRDAGDVLALAAPCDDVPVAAVDVVQDPPGSSGSMHGFAFTVTADVSIEPGLEVAVHESVASWPPAWAFGYVSHQWPLQTARSGGALQILVRVKEDAKCMGEQVLLESIRTLSHHCEWALRYPLYVLHTATLEGVDIQALLAWTDTVRRAARPSLSLRFLDVSEEFSRVRFGDGSVKLGELDLMWLDLTSPRSRRIREEKPRRFKVGYRHMCRFHSSTLMELPVFASTRYLMHLDEDATLLCRPGSSGPDPIREVARSSAVYGLFEVGTEDPAYSIGWTGFVEEYLLLHEVQPPVPFELLSSSGALFTKEDDDHPGQLVNVTTDQLAVTWGTAWEVLDLDFFLSAPVLEFTHKVERSLGHYRHNWGDHLVRAYQVQLFAPLSRVRCFDAEELPGRHGCGGYMDEMGSEFVYQFIQDIACPEQWTAHWLHDVEWPPAENSPRPCLVLCNQLLCEGFDMVFFADSNTAHCILRLGRGTPETCLGGGIEGPAGAAWAGAGLDLGSASLVGTANRYQLIERSLNRTLNCTRWRADLATRLTDA